MKTKRCFKCTRNSYSSYNMGEWLCPYCGTDLTGVPSHNASNYGNEANKKEDKDCENNDRGLVH